VRVLVLGCGEAFDNDLFNTSLLVRTGAATLLLDCGYSIPARLWQACPDPNEVDLIYISHAHADHYFGLPAVLGRMWEDGRTKPLTILTQPQVSEQITAAMELGYRTLSTRFVYAIRHVAAEPGGELRECSAVFRFAPTKHSVTNLAVRIETQERSLCYSGDGMFTGASEQLIAAADLAFHEAYAFEPSPVHADIPALLAMAARRNVRELALVHVQRTVRRDPARIAAALSGLRAVKASMPEPGAEYIIS
jgi:ribonuclease BN (tRNA processing enzyme)